MLMWRSRSGRFIRSLGNRSAATGKCMGWFRHEYGRLAWMGMTCRVCMWMATMKKGMYS